MPTATFSVQTDWDAAVTNAFTIGVSTLGGGDVLTGLFGVDFSGTYDDLTAETKSFRITRGRDDNLDPMRAGECTITLKDSTGKFNPKNASSVLTGQLLPMRPVRIRATLSGTTYGLFRGFVRSIDHNAEARESTIHAVDLFIWLSRVSPTIASATTTTGSAIGLILDAVGYTDPAFRDLDTGDSITFSADGTVTALALIEGLLEAERGVFYISGSGVATYETRHAKALRTTSSATLTNVLTEIQPGIDLDRIRNRWTVIRDGGGTATSYDADSQATYGWADGGQITTSYLADDSAGTALANYLVALRKDPRAPVRGVEMVNQDTATYTQALTRELQDRVTVVESGISGTTGDYHIESVEHEVSDGGLLHRTSWAVSERGDDVFVLGVSTLGGGDVLSY